MTPGIEPIDDAERVDEIDHILHKWTSQSEYDPIFVQAAADCRLTDDRGETYLDAFSQSWFALGGHTPARVAAAVARQAQRLATVHAGAFSTQPRRHLARKLLDLLPDGFRRVFFGSNGSDAVELSLKLARMGTGRQGVVAFSHSYHGASMGATSVTGLAHCRDGFGEPVPGTTFTPYPYCYRCPLALTYPSCDLACADLLEDALQTESAHGVAAIIGEPIAAVGGIIVPPQPFWRRVREIADNNNVWYISDEVVTGFGRCGSWFAMEQYDAIPDIVTLGKGLTGGVQPLSAAVLGTKVELAIADIPLYHGMTFQGHSVATAAGLANIEHLEHEKLVAHGAALGEKLERSLRELATRHECIGDVRGVGAMWALELVRDRNTREPFPPGHPFVDARGRDTDAGTWAAAHLLQTRRVFVGSAPHIIEIAPPLILSESELDELITALDETLSYLTTSLAG